MCNDRERKLTSRNISLQADGPYQRCLVQKFITVPLVQVIFDVVWLQTRQYNTTCPNNDHIKIGLLASFQEFMQNRTEFLLV